MSKQYTKHKLSVCICAYNEQEYISRCLDSVLAQVNVDIDEILVGINSSNDSTEDIVNQYALSDRRIKVVNSPKGKANAWNALNAAARNNFRIFQDGDCLAFPERSYSQLLSSINDLDILGASIKRVVEGKSLIVKIINFPKHFVRKKAYLNGTLYLLNYEKVNQCLEKAIKSKQMPQDIINDDAFLQMVCDNVAIRDDVYVLVRVADNIAQEVKRYQRMHLGEMQLAERYPDLYDQKIVPLRKHSKIKQWQYMFKFLTIKEKILFPAFMIIKFFIFRYIHRLEHAVDQTSRLNWK
jgi:glycosyltransferase involved in cell wall biosynthesis